MTTTRRSGRPQTSSFHTLVTYPEQHIVESVETTQHQADRLSNNVDGGAHEGLTATQQTQAIVHTASDSWTSTATIVRVDSFSRTRNDDDEDIFIGDDATDDGDTVVTQVRIEEDVAMQG